MKPFKTRNVHRTSALLVLFSLVLLAPTLDSPVVMAKSLNVAQDTGSAAGDGEGKPEDWTSAQPAYSSDYRFHKPIITTWSSFFDLSLTVLIWWL